MAIYHLSVKTVSRSVGRSATAAAAYRAGVEITDERTGLVHDYRRKGGVDRESPGIVLPAGAPQWAADRSALWNAAEQAETRKNSTVAREFQVALPDELTPHQRRALVVAISREIADRHGVAVDAQIHAPDQEGDARNWHAHILTSTRRLGPEGFGEKARELDDQKTGPAIVTEWRARWAELSNQALERAGVAARIDHRSLAAQRAEAIDRGELVPEREATQHQGPAVTNMERKAKREAQEIGEEYTPVTAVAQENQARQVRNEGRAKQLARWLRERAEAIAEAAIAAAAALAEAGKAAFGERYATVTAGKTQFLEQWRDHEYQQVKAQQEREFAASLQREQQAQRREAAERQSHQLRGPSRDDGPGMSR